MPKTSSLLKFAQSHDWGKTAYLDGDSVMVYDNEIDQVVAFHNITDLRAWAGY